MNKELITKILLVLILILALVLRVYKLDQVPPSISWDEASFGYNSFTIANYGKDEHGKFLPFTFRAFGEDKQPVDIYITAFFVKFLGLSEFSTRFPVAIFGVLNAGLIFYLAKILFNKTSVGLLAALFLSLSPQNIFFSRFNHEANFALFFFMTGVVLFLISVKRGKNLLMYSILSFGISMLTYLAAKIIVPIMLIFLIALYKDRLIKMRKSILMALLVIGSFFILFILQPKLFLSSRIQQTIQGEAEIEKTRLYKMTENKILGRVDLIFTQYLWHFSPQYLFLSGDENPRLSASSAGEFYLFDAIFLLLGFVYCLHKRSKEAILLLSWAVISPLPSAMAAEAPHAGRSMFMMGSFHITSALGFYFALSLFKKMQLKFMLICLTMIVLTLSAANYLNYYFGEYAKRYAIEWQYGMKQIVEYVKGHSEYNQVFMTDARSQPYIFFLYYLKPDLAGYVRSVYYNNSDSKSYNNVSNFSNFYFGGWDPVESLPNKGVLYIVTPSQYDGLRHKAMLNVKKIIFYPNGLPAFYLVSAD